MSYFVIYKAEDYLSIEELPAAKLLAAIAPYETGESRDYGHLTFLTELESAYPEYWPIRSMLIIEGRIITPDAITSCACACHDYPGIYPTSLGRPCGVCGHVVQEET